MPSPDNDAFIQAWPKCFVAFLGVIELLAVIVFVLTELGNVAASFWITNVFAGGWCGLVMFIHAIALFVTACCAPGQAAAFRSVIITIIALVACAALISFDAVFIAQPSTCILTSSCAANSVSTTIFSYNFQTSFYTVFNSLNPFKNYTPSQAKLLFQSVQLGVGCLCFLICIIYLIVYFVSKSKVSNRVGSNPQQQGYGAPQPQYQQPAPNYYQQLGPSYRQQPRIPQAPPGEIPWNPNRRY